MRLRRLTLGFAATIAAGMGMSCAAALAPTSSLASLGPVSTQDGVRFALVQPDASNVAVAGTFNQWSTSSHPLERDRSSGEWTALVRLAPGEHLFMYVVDGTLWLSPPAAEGYVDDGFGARNGVVVVHPVER